MARGTNQGVTAIALQRIEDVAKEPPQYLSERKDDLEEDDTSSVSH